jgi:hypothetical protein
MDGFIRQVQGLAKAGQIMSSHVLQLMNSAQAILYMHMSKVFTSKMGRLHPPFDGL